MERNKRNVLFITLVFILSCCLFTALFGNNYAQKNVSASSENPYYSIGVSSYELEYSANSNPYVSVTIDYTSSSDLRDDFNNDADNWYFLTAYGEPSQIEYVYDVFSYYLKDTSDGGFLFRYYKYGDFVNSGSQKYFRCYDDNGNSIYDNISFTADHSMLEVFKFLKSCDVADGFNYVRMDKSHFNGTYFSHTIGYNNGSYDGKSDLSFFSLLYYEKNGVPYGYDCDFVKTVYLSSNCSNAFNFSYKSVLSSSELQTRVKAWEHVLGVYREGYTTVTYDYIVMQDGHFNKYETKTGSVLIPSYLIPFEDYVENEILNCDYLNGKGIIGFNANFVSTAGYVMSNGEIEKKETFGSKVIRQAMGFNYSYNSHMEKIPASASMDVKYTDYNYKDFCIRIQNSNRDFPNDLSVNVYPTSIKEDDGKFYLYFNYQKIFDLFGNTLQWTVLQDEFTISYNQSDVKDGVSVTEIVDVENGKSLCVTVSKYRQDELFGLEITGQAPITEPLEMDVTVRYGILNNELNFSFSEFSVGKIFDNKFGELKAELLSENGSYADKIYGSIENDVTDEVSYMRPVDVVYVANYENFTAIFQVYYEELPVFVITNNVNSDVVLKSILNSVAVQSLKDYDISIPNGYRVKDIECSSRIVFIDGFYDKNNPLNSQFSINNGKGEVGIKLILTDNWQIKVNYLEQYKNSCFAVMKEFNGEIKVADYADIFALSGSDVSKILGQNIVVLNFNKKSVKIDNVNVTFDENNLIYTVNLTYTPLSVKMTNSDGDASELLIGLTPYSQWKQTFGENWSIVYLAPNVFQYTNDVEEDKLYGFFSVVTFKEQITNFNSWFKNYTSDGCVTAFSRKEVKGSEWYKFLNDSGPFFAIGGGTIGLLFGRSLTSAAVGVGLKYSLMSAAELANDENGTYYSYFFYLDGTSDKSFVSHNGADNYDDEDSALKNKTDDVANEVKDFFSETWNKIKSFFNDTTVGKIIKWTVIVLGVAIALTFVIVVIKWIYRKITS